MMIYTDFVRLLENTLTPEYDSSRMRYIIECNGEYNEDNITISISKLSSIRRFYESTNKFNRTKIADLINNNIRNIDKVYMLVIEYEKIKNQKEYNNGT